MLIATLRTLLLLCVLIPSGLSAAGDHDRARSAVEAGEVRSLGQILPGVRSRFPGRVLDAKLQQRKGAWLYRLKILNRDGKVTKVTVDARTGAVLKAK